MESPAWPHILLAIALALFNGVAFPLWTGYSGGATTPLPAEPAAVAPYLLVAALNAGGLLLVGARSGSRGIRARDVLLLAVLTRVVYYVVRFAQGALVVDQDVELFFSYGREFASGRYPEMEYPQGAMLLFAGEYLLSGGSLATFRLVFPLASLLSDLVTLGSLLWLGRRYSVERTSTLLALFYALSPFTLALWYGKYDVVPAALLMLGVALFVAHRYSLSALALGMGFLTKWFPGIAIPFLVLYLLRAQGFRAALRYAAVAAIAVVLPLVPFWLISPEKVVYTYTAHMGRPVMGQSLMYIPVYLFDPGARLTSDTSPWNDTEGSRLDGTATTLIMLAGEILLLARLAWKPAREESAVTFAGLGIAAFILLNRVFSPQFLLVLFVAYSVGFISQATRHRGAWIAALALLALTLLSYFVWPLWYRDWLAVSALFWAANLAVVGCLILWDVRPGAVGQPRTAGTPLPAGSGR